VKRWDAATRRGKQSLAGLTNLCIELENVHTEGWGHLGDFHTIVDRVGHKLEQQLKPTYAELAGCH
jgi:hypothetical protein